MITPTDSFSMKKVTDVTDLPLDGGGVSAGERRTPEIVKNFSSNPKPYFERLKILRDQTFMNFESRGGKFFKNVIDHFSSNYGGNSFFAINSGNPAGGQTKALIDLPLTDASLGYFNKDYIGMKILTPSSVMQRTGHVGRYGNEHNNPPAADMVRAEGRANVKQLNPYQYDFLNYHVGSYAIKDSLSPDDYMNSMRPFDPEQDVVIALKELLMLIFEIQIAGILTNTAGYHSDSVITLGNAADRFDAPSTSSIDKQAMDLRNAIRTRCGVDPNTLVMDANTFEAVSRHPQARGSLYNTVSTHRTATEEEVMKLFQVDRLFVGRTSRTSSNAPNAARARVWGKDIWMGYVNPTKARRQLTFGYYHHFRNADSFVISRQSVGDPRNKEIFSYLSWQHHITDYNCGGLIKNAIS